jgi:beta-glucanase (GH16 family)
MLTVCVLFVMVGAVRAGEWQLVWSDEFDDEGLPDKTKWGYEEGFVRNHEKQYYTRQRKENVRVENGMLIIEGRKEEMKNARYKAGSEDWREKNQFASYTSGSINTLGRHSFQYGRIEVRAKVPQGKGMWPAIWMMGTNRTQVGWPRCGEIDIMEYVGKDPNTIHANNHFADPKLKDTSLKGKAVHRSAGKGKIRIDKPYADFHVYAIEWDEQQIKFFVDDTQYATFDIDAADEGPDNPFRQPHYLLLNFAMGGSWGGPIDDSVLPQKYEIDYVRYYKAEADPQENAG